MIAVSIASWVFHDAGAAFLTRARVPLDFATAVLLASLVIIWCAEQAYPIDPEWNYRLLASPISRATEGWNRLARDLAYLFIVTFVGSLLIGWVARQLETRASSLSALHVWPTEAPFVVRVVLAFFAVELLSYWFHRLAHRVKVFWRFHQTHHVVTELTSLKALRTHPIDNLFFYLARSMPLLLIGADPAELVAVVYFGATLSLLSHANVDVSDRVLGWVVNFPRYHAVHHSSQIAETNSNFGCHTIVWDRVFGTFRPQAAGAIELGVHPRGRRSLWHELVMPPKSETFLEGGSRRHSGP